MKALAAPALLLSALLLPAKGAPEDVARALEELEAKAAPLLRLKGIDWKKVRSETTKAAAAARTRDDHYAVLVRLVARLRDGHAAVRTTEATKDAKWPGPPMDRGPGMSWCASGGKVLVKSAWGSAGAAGVKAGMEVVKADDLPARKWLDRRIAELRDTHGFSTPQQAEYFACHWGLGGEAGSTLSLELRSPDGKAKKATLTRNEGGLAAVGPAFFPEGLKTVGRQSYGRTAKGFAYVHLRDVPQDLPAQLDEALAAVGDAPGLVLDFRANGGGAVDHDAVVGRFVPKGKPLAFNRTFQSAGERPYAGPVVAIVDAGVRSAGETVSGYLKEYGRVFLIGEAPTAGMSSSKETLDLPSGLYSIYFSVRSNGRECNAGRGIEGIGIEPHEVVPYAAADLVSGIDTLTRRAEELLAKFPQDRVPYRPPR
jgi:C-terminal processing protease CtpA/Prc